MRISRPQLQQTFEAVDARHVQIEQRHIERLFAREHLDRLIDRPRFDRVDVGVCHLHSAVQRIAKQRVVVDDQETNSFARSGHDFVTGCCRR